LVCKICFKNDGDGEISTLSFGVAPQVSPILRQLATVQVSLPLFLSQFELQQLLENTETLSNMSTIVVIGDLLDSC